MHANLDLKFGVTRRERERKRAVAWRNSVLNYHPRGIAPAWAGEIIATFRFSAVDELLEWMATEVASSEGGEPFSQPDTLIRERGAGLLEGVRQSSAALPSGGSRTRASMDRCAAPPSPQ